MDFIFRFSLRIFAALFFTSFSGQLLVSRHLMKIYCPNIHDVFPFLEGFSNYSYLHFLHFLRVYSRSFLFLYAFYSGNPYALSTRPLTVIVSSWYTYIFSDLSSYQSFIAYTSLIFYISYFCLYILIFLKTSLRYLFDVCSKHDIFWPSTTMYISLLKKYSPYVFFQHNLLMQHSFFWRYL